MEKEIKFYVVRASFGALVYESLDFAKEEVKFLLCNTPHSELFVTIECWEPLMKPTRGRQWVCYNKRKVATCYEFDNATEDSRLEFFAKNFAKTNGSGYARKEVYIFGVSGGKFLGSCNGRPTDVEFISYKHHCNHWPLSTF